MIHSTTDFINHTEWNQMTGTEDIVVEKKCLCMKDLVKKQTLSKHICKNKK